MSASENIFSGAFSGVLIAPIQDLVAAFKILTTKYFYVNEFYKNFIIKNITTDRTIDASYVESGLRVYHGKNIFSLILPARFNYTSFDEVGKVRIRIVDGIFGRGRDRQVLGDEAAEGFDKRNLRDLRRIRDDQVPGQLADTGRQLPQGLRADHGSAGLLF
ncbi:unnamed protein product [Sphagnum jensenii]